MRLPASTVARALSGEASCLHKIWWELRHTRPEPDHARMVGWNIEHTRAVRRVAIALEGLIEAEVPVQHELGIHGRIDLVQTLDGETTIHEVKTGRAGPADLVQLMLYMTLLRERRKGDLRGILHRPTGTIEVPYSDLPLHFEERVREVTAMLLSPNAPPQIQERACNWCTVRACPSAARAIEVSPTADPGSA